MGWNRVKIVMITVLFAFNLFLMYMIGEQSRASEYIPEESVSRIVELLRKDGILVGEGALSRKKESPVIYGGECGNEYYAATASSLSGSSVSLSFPTPSGVVLSMKNGDRCSFESGFRIRYEASGCTALLEAQGFFDTAPDEIAKIAPMPLSARQEKDLSAVVNRFLSRTDGTLERSAQYTLGYDVLFCGENKESGVRYLLCVQTVEGMRITTSCAAFAVYDGRVLGMNGEWCFADIQTTYSAQIYDQIHILYSVKERIRAEEAQQTVLTAISLVYAVNYHADTGTFFLIPAWSVTTDAGVVYLWNGVNGEFYTD